MKSKSVSTGIICVLGIGLVMFLLVYALFSDPAEVRVQKPASEVNYVVSDRGKSEGKAVSTNGSDRAGNRINKKNQKRLTGWTVVDEFDGYTGKDRELAVALQAANDSDDHNRIIAAAVAALSSANAELRLEAVNSLGWCGKDALAELTGMLADANDDVRDSAINNWESALAEVDDSKLRYRTALSVMGTITKDDALESISGQFGNAAQEYIDEVDDEVKQNSRRTEVVQQLYDIINGPKSVCAEKAKEAYSDLTGHDWVSAEEAEKYLANPDEYEPPESK